MDSCSDSTVFSSRFGYHPVDRATCRKLRRINGLINVEHERFLRDISRRGRWLAKQPQNRILWKTIRNEQGQKIGREKIGPAPEPVPVKPRYTEYQGYYQQARMPKANPGSVMPLPVSIEDIDRVLAELGS